METKNNQEELLNKRDVLSEEELMEVAGGNDVLNKLTGGPGYDPQSPNDVYLCMHECAKHFSAAEVQKRCKDPWDAKNK